MIEETILEPSESKIRNTQLTFLCHALTPLELNLALHVLASV